MKRAEYPATTCREPLSSSAGLTYLCELVVEHPGPCASFSIARTVTARNAWEMANPGWESGVGTRDLIVLSPNFPGESATLEAPQEKERTMAPKYRRFRTSIDPVLRQDKERYLIVEVEGTDESPSGWTDGLVTERDAWDRARAQANPVVVIPLEGEPKEFGVIFHPAIFEKLAYRGYVNYNYAVSMEDDQSPGLDEKTWISAFRSQVSKAQDDLIAVTEGPSPEFMLMHDEIWRDIDVSNDVKCALGAYAKAIKERGL